MNVGRVKSSVLAPILTQNRISLIIIWAIPPMMNSNRRSSRLLAGLIGVHFTANLQLSIVSSTSLSPCHLRIHLLRFALRAISTDCTYQRCGRSLRSATGPVGHL